MVSARPQFEAACQLQKFAGLAQWQCRELVPLRRVFDSLDQLQIRWRDWPNGIRLFNIGADFKQPFQHWNVGILDCIN
jgi:hypothetical protein